MRHLSNYKPSQREAIELRYKQEDKVMQLIATGNVNEMEDFLSQVDEGESIVHRLPEDPLRDRKNGLIIRNTMFRIAARNGGLPAVLLHFLSEKYALTIERATSVEYLDEVVAREQVMEYVEAVQQFSTISYSEIIKDVVSYITENLTEQISLHSIAEAFHIHPAHLSRKFKQETNQTVMDYIHFHRVNHAKLLFQQGNTNILNVANLSGFNSSSYFNRIFKKITNQTPTSYLKANYS